MSVTLAEIRDVIALQLGADRVEDHYRLVADLGAESADLLNLVVVLESRYGIHVAEEAIPGLETVADVHRLVVAATEGSLG